MKNNIQMKRFEADEQARNVADLEHVIREFEGMAADLDRQIKAEEARTGVNDPARFAYSTFAKSAILRRDNLRASAKVLSVKLEEENSRCDGNGLVVGGGQPSSEAKRKLVGREGGSRLAKSATYTLPDGGSIALKKLEIPENIGRSERI